MTNAPNHRARPPADRAAVILSSLRTALEAGAEPVTSWPCSDPASGRQDRLCVRWWGSRPIWPPLVIAARRLGGLWTVVEVLAAGHEHPLRPADDPDMVTAVRTAARDHARTCERLDGLASLLRAACFRVSDVERDAEHGLVIELVEPHGDRLWSIWVEPYATGTVAAPAEVGDWYCWSAVLGPLRPVDDPGGTVRLVGEFLGWPGGRQVHLDGLSGYVGGLGGGRVVGLKRGDRCAD